MRKIHVVVQPNFELLKKFNMTRFSQTFSSNQKPKRSRFQFSKKVIWSVVLVTLVAALGIYLLEVNTIAAKGFQIREFEKQVYSLREQNDKLAIEVVEMRSMNNLDEQVSELGMVTVEDILYYDVAGQVVARR